MLQLFGDGSPTGEVSSSENSTEISNDIVNGQIETREPIEASTQAEISGDATNNMRQAAMPHKFQKLIKELCVDLEIDSDDETVITAAYNNRRLRTTLESKLKAEQAEKTYKSLLSQAKEFEEKNSSFTLDNALSKPKFTRLLNSGFGIEESWNIINADEILAKAVEEAEMRGQAKAISLLRAGSLRPDENGMSEQGGISRKTKVESLTGGGIRDILRRVEKGAKVNF